MNQFEVDYIQGIGTDACLISLRPKSAADCFEYQAGQYVSIGFERFGRRTPMRCFSIVSAPTQPELQVAMRIKGNFTKALQNTRPGDTVYVQGPFGSFTLDSQYDRRAVFIAAGIGITPFMSMLRELRDKPVPSNITLLYRSGRNQEILFKDELLALQNDIPNFRVVFFVGESGPVVTFPGAIVVRESITEKRLQQATANQFGNVTFFICGPQGFMTGIEKTLLANGVWPNRIVTESFTQGSEIGSSWSVSKLTYAFASLLVVAGVGAIMALDLIRQVPKLASANTATTITPTSSQTTQSSTTTPSTDDDTATTTTTPTASTSPSTTTATSTPTTPTASTPTPTTTPTPTPTYTYVPPRSHQS